MSELTREVLLQEIATRHKRPSVASEDLATLINGLERVGDVLRELSSRIAHASEPTLNASEASALIPIATAGR